MPGRPLKSLDTKAVFCEKIRIVKNKEEKLDISKPGCDLIKKKFRAELDRLEVRGHTRKAALEWLDVLLIDIAIMSLLVEGEIKFSHWNAEKNIPGIRI